MLCLFVTYTINSISILSALYATIHNYNKIDTKL